MDRWDRLDDIIGQLERFLVAILLSLMIIVAFSQIVLRNVFATGLSWGDPLVRHLVLPGGLAGTEDSMRFLAEEVSGNTCVNVMDQYYPSFQANLHPPLDRRVTREEYLEARNIAKELGLRLVEEL